MTDILKQIGIRVAVVVVALLLTGGFGGSTGVGGTYEITKQFFSAGIEATDVTVTDDLVVGSAAATSSSNFGKACFTVTTQAGGTLYVFFRSTGIATSSTSCL